MTCIERSNVGSSLYSIKWESQDTHILNGIRNILSQNHIHANDVTLACEGHYFQAHKLLLSICSSYFKDLIEKNCSDFTKTVIILAHVTPKCLGYILDFIYKGEVTIPEKYIDVFMDTGKILKISGLMNYDIRYTIPQKIIKRQSEDIYDDFSYSNPPATPGSLMVQTESKKAEVMSSSTYVATSTKNLVKFDKLQQGNNSFESTFFNYSPKIKSDATARDASQKASVNENKSSSPNLTFNATENEKVTSAALIPPSAQVDINEDFKEHKPGEYENQSNDSDNESTGNIFEDDEESIISSSEESFFEESYKEPEVIDLENDINFETTLTNPPSQSHGKTPLRTINYPHFRKLLVFNHQENQNELSKVCSTFPDINVDDTNDKTRKCQLAHSELQSLKIDGENAYILRIEETKMDTMSTNSPPHNTLVECADKPCTSLQLSIPISLNRQLSNKRKLSSKNN